MSFRAPTSVILKSEGRASWGSLSTLVKHNNANSPVLARDSRLRSFVAFGNDALLSYILKSIFRTF